MTQEDKELLLADLCARLPYGIKVAISHFDEDGSLKRISEPKIVDGYYDEKFTGPKCYGFGIYEVKPYLRPLSSMTREEVGEYISLKEDIVGSDGITYFFETYKSIDWLNKKMFDYRKDDEGKTMIEKGLALEAPKGMYNINEK